MSQPGNRVAQSLWQPAETNPIIIQMLALCQTPNHQLETALFNLVGPKLKIPHHEDLLIWIESDEVSPFFNEFRRSWLEPEANSFADLGWRVRHPPHMRDVAAALTKDLESNAGKFVHRETGALAPKHKPQQKKKWKAADHWAYFIVQVMGRARAKTDRAWYGADLPAEEREFPSLWPGAEGMPDVDKLIGLYALLRCLVESYYLERKDQVWLERALDREVMEMGF